MDQIVAHVQQHAYKRVTVVSTVIAGLTGILKMAVFRSGPWLCLLEEVIDRAETPVIRSSTPVKAR